LTTNDKARSLSRDIMKSASEWSQLLDEIRHIPQFQDFLRQLQASYLLKISHQTVLSFPSMFTVMLWPSSLSLAPIHPSTSLLMIFLINKHLPSSNNVCVVFFHPMGFECGRPIVEDAQFNVKTSKSGVRYVSSSKNFGCG